MGRPTAGATTSRPAGQRRPQRNLAGYSDAGGRRRHARGGERGGGTDSDVGGHTCGLTPAGAALLGLQHLRPARSRHHYRSGSNARADPLRRHPGGGRRGIELYRDERRPRPYLRDHVSGCRLVLGLSVGGRAGQRGGGNPAGPGGGDRRGELRPGECRLLSHLRRHGGGRRALLGAQPGRPAGRRHARPTDHAGGGHGGVNFIAVARGGPLPAGSPRRARRGAGGSMAMASWATGAPPTGWLRWR